MAFHQTPNGVSCPPEGQWQHVYETRYDQIYTYSKKDGVKLPDLPSSVSVCGDPSGKFNGEYFYDKDEKSFKQPDSFNHIYFDEANRFWVVFHPVFGGHTNVGNYHTIGDDFELFGANWVMAGKDGQKARFLPGQTLSKSSDWSAAPESFTIVAGNGCPDNNALPSELHVCGAG